MAQGNKQSSPAPASSPAQEPPPPINLRYFVLSALVGFVFCTPFAMCVVWLLSTRAGRLTFPELITLAACISICAGITFSAAIVNATGEIKLTRLGLTLTGGAAIGLGTVVVLFYTLRPQPPFTIISIAAPKAPISGKGVGISRMYPLEEGRYLVEFSEGVESDWIEYQRFEPSGQVAAPVRIIVDRYGVKNEKAQ